MLRERDSKGVSDLSLIRKQGEETIRSLIDSIYCMRSSSPLASFLSRQLLKVSAGNSSKEREDGMLTDVKKQLHMLSKESRALLSRVNSEDADSLVLAVVESSQGQPSHVARLLFLQLVEEAQEYKNSSAVNLESRALTDTSAVASECSNALVEEAQECKNSSAANPESSLLTEASDVASECGNSFTQDAVIEKAVQKIVADLVNLSGMGIYIHTHTHIHPFIHPSIHPSIHPYMQACMHTYIHTYTPLRTSAAG